MKTKDSIRHESTSTRSLPVRLTHEELLDRAQRQAWALQTLAKVEASQKSAKERMKEELAEAEGAVSELARVLREEAEDRPVDVAKVHDDPAHQVLYIRTDTGEVIESREQYDSERQAEFTDGEASDLIVESVRTYRERARFLPGEEEKTA